MFKMYSINYSKKKKIIITSLPRTKKKKSELIFDIKLILDFLNMVSSHKTMVIKNITYTLYI